MDPYAVRSAVGIAIAAIVAVAARATSILTRRGAIWARSGKSDTPRRRTHGTVGVSIDSSQQLSQLNDRYIHILNSI